MEMKDKAYSICRDFLSGEWKRISSDDMVFRTVSGGLSNFLFYCSLPSTHTPLNGEPSQVMLRMYGQLHDGGGSDAKITDSVITMLLSERKIGPKLYGIFPGGRLEEYIPARAMTCEELKNPIYSASIARKLAKVHCLDVPINKEPTWLFETMSRWLEQMRSTHIDFDQLVDNCCVDNHCDRLPTPSSSSSSLSLSSSPPSTSSSTSALKANNNHRDHHHDHHPLSTKILAQQLHAFDFESELTWLQQFLKDVPSPTVFCHNDLQEGNILLPDLSASNHANSSPTHKLKAAKFDDRVVFIDFEYCSYNYRGFDLANHFCEYMFDYSNPEWPHFYANYEAFPDRQQKRYFVREYLKQSPEYRRLKDGSREKVAAEDSLIDEADCYVLASHLLWTFWSINNAHSSNIKFGYWEYGNARLKAYNRHKKWLLKRRPTTTRKSTTKC